MKIIRILFVAVLLILFHQKIKAQTLNWSAIQPQQKHIANANFGFDNGVTYGVGYGYHFNAKLPFVLNIEHSQPSGSKILDDFKTKIGGQVRLLKVGDFAFSGKVQGVFRRHESSQVRLLNFGSDMSAAIGYYKPMWFAAGEFGFDKAIVTNFKHSNIFKEEFPDVKDGWYEPATGGSFYYGLQAGVSMGKIDITLRGGKTVEQDLKTRAIVPFYFQVGINSRF